LSSLDSSGVPGAVLYRQGWVKLLS
jgi:hypothetical protein